MTFWAQIQYAAIKVARVTTLLSKLVANIGGSEIWAEALKISYKMKILSSVQRTAALKAALYVDNTA